ncbi:MAG: DGQHR domain-containing protein [bacterium]|nr:DGQHR domain-containing protein [bacterium]
MKTEDLVKSENISTWTINNKRSAFDFCTVKPSKKLGLENDGWEFVPSKHKKSIRMKKEKPHWKAYQDRVWALFAKMEFHHMNLDDQFKVEYASGLTKKVDVFAADEEAIIFVECKSCATRKKESYQKDINEIIAIKDGLRQAAQNMVTGKPRVAFIFATNNSILSENDRKRLEEGSIFYFNEANIEYWEQLTDHLGHAAKYQLFGKLFAGQDIPKLPNRVPAIKGKMSAGHTFYSFSIDPKSLLKMSFVLHRTESDVEASEAYQRLVSKSRLGEIGKYVDGGGYFPNSVIVNIETKKKNELKFDQASVIDHDSETSFGVLHLPKVYRSAFVIDGQHRLYGYSRAKSKSNHTIPVVAFHNLPQMEQAKIFVDINHHQKSVPTNLLRSIMADFNWKSDDAGQALLALKTRLLTHLNFDDSSPFYKRIVLAEEKKTETRCLTLETISNWGLSNKMGFFGKIKGKKLIKSGYLTDVGYDETLNKSIAFFKKCFGYIEDELQDQWRTGSGEGGFIAMNIGIAATMRVLDHILDHLVKFDNLNPEDLSGEELADQVIPYLVPVIDFVEELDSEGLKKLRSYFGSGAPEKVTMEFLYAIHKEFTEFSPEGLEQWIKEHSGVFNKPAWEVGHNNIEPLIHDFIVQMLKKELGEKKWWIEGVPKEIQKSCSDASIDEGSDEPHWHFLNTIHYNSIILKHWGILGEYFTPHGMETVKKEKKLSWLAKFNSVRKKYSHPQREVITEDEYNFLEETYNWLQWKLMF